LVHGPIPSHLITIAEATIDMNLETETEIEEETMIGMIGMTGLTGMTEMTEMVERIERM